MRTIPVCRAVRLQLMVGAIPQKLQRVDSANSLFYKKVRSNILPLFPWIHIQHSTFHQADCGGSLQTIRQFRRSDRKPVRLPIRLKNSEHFHTSPYPNIEDSTFHRRASVPLSLQNGKRVAFFPFVHLYPFNIYKNIFRFIPAICKDCTVSRIPPGFLPTYEPWLIPPRIPKGFADSEQSLRLSGPPFLSRKEQFGMLAQIYLQAC